MTNFPNPIGPSQKSLEVFDKNIFSKSNNTQKTDQIINSFFPHQKSNSFKKNPEKYFRKKYMTKWPEDLVRV